MKKPTLSLTQALNNNANYLNIKTVAQGNRVLDVPRTTVSIDIDEDAGTVSIKGPFKTTMLTPRPFGHRVEVIGSGEFMTTTDFNKAIETLCATAWHVGIRGVIC